MLWLTKNCPQLSDGQIVKLVGSVTKTVNLIRNNSYWNSSNLSPKDPVVSSLCSQDDIQKELEKAKRRISNKNKKLVKAQNENKI